VYVGLMWLLVGVKRVVGVCVFWMRFDVNVVCDGDDEM